jgi:hypothetical protein
MKFDDIKWRIYPFPVWLIASYLQKADAEDFPLHQSHQFLSAFSSFSSLQLSASRGMTLLY